MGILQSVIERLPPSWLRVGARLRGRFPIIKKATDWMPGLLRHRQGVIRNGVGRGLKFNGGASAVGFLLGTHDTDVQYAMARLLRPAATCYDIGANVGFTAILAAKCVGPYGRVECFEPLSENVAQIRVNADLNIFAHIHIHQVALGGNEGVAEFRTSHAPTWGRLAEVGATPEQSGMIRVPVRRLDGLVVSERLPDPQFIKMDVEGAEAEVLAGAREMLARARPVMVIELHHTHQAVIDTLAGLGYVVRPLVPGGRLERNDGEFQVLAYPEGHSDAEALWADVQGGCRLDGS